MYVLHEHSDKQLRSLVTHEISSTKSISSWLLMLARSASIS